MRVCDAKQKQFLSWAGQKGGNKGVYHLLLLIHDPRNDSIMSVRETVYMLQVDMKATTLWVTWPYFVFLLKEWRKDENEFWRLMNKCLKRFTAHPRYHSRQRFCFGLVSARFSNLTEVVIIGLAATSIYFAGLNLLTNLHRRGISCAPCCISFRAARDSCRGNLFSSPTIEEEEHVAWPMHVPQFFTWFSYQEMMIQCILDIWSTVLSKENWPYRRYGLL